MSAYLRDRLLWCLQGILSWPSCRSLNHLFHERHSPSIVSILKIKIPIYPTCSSYKYLKTSFWLLSLGPTKCTLGRESSISPIDVSPAVSNRGISTEKLEFLKKSKKPEQRNVVPRSGEERDVHWELNLGQLPCLIADCGLRILYELLQDLLQINTCPRGKESFIYIKECENYCDKKKNSLNLLHSTYCKFFFYTDRQNLIFSWYTEQRLLSK